MREQDVLDALHLVIDPEVGINVVDLGLIYGVVLDGNKVAVQMTMTTPACPLGPYLTEQATATIAHKLPAVESVDVQVVWDPPWDSSRISTEGKRQLGWE